MTQICDFYRALLKDVDNLPKELRGLVYKCCQSHFTTKCLVIWAERVVNGLALFTETQITGTTSMGINNKYDILKSMISKLK